MRQLGKEEVDDLGIVQTYLPPCSILPPAVEEGRSGGMQANFMCHVSLPPPIYPGVMVVCAFDVLQCMLGK